MIVNDVSVAYPASPPALTGVTLQAPAGRTVALLGAAGSGRSTLLHAMAGHLTALGARLTGGQITLEGRPLPPGGVSAAVRRGVVLVLPGGRVALGLSVAENLRLAEAVPRPRAERRQAREQVAELLPGLLDRGPEPAGRLDAAARTELGLARALLTAPRVLLIDELSAGLPPVGVARLGQLLRRVRGLRPDLAMVLADQNAALALTLADEAYVLDAGRVRLGGPAAQVRAGDETRRLLVGRGGETQAAAAARLTRGFGSGDLAGPISRPLTAITLTRWER